LIFNYLKSLAGPPRFERKFVIEEMNVAELEAILKANSQGIREIYHKRQINNIYFDSENLSNYWENESGNYLRVKTRIRWYGHLIGYSGAANLEFKLKEGYVGNKVNMPLTSFNLEKIKGRDWIMECPSQKLPPHLVEYLKTLRPTLLNSYMRKYFVSLSKNIRFTIDYDIGSHRQYFNNNPRAGCNISLGEKIVLEVKYSLDHDEEARDFLQKFPFRLTKNSKYALGLEML